MTHNRMRTIKMDRISYWGASTCTAFDYIIVAIKLLIMQLMGHAEQTGRVYHISVREPEGAL
jgi:hypothetical protein